MLEAQRSIAVDDIVRVPCIGGNAFGVVEKVFPRKMAHWKSQAVIPWVQVYITYQRMQRGYDRLDDRIELPTIECVRMTSLPYSIASKMIGSDGLALCPLKTRYKEEQGFLVGNRRWVTHGVRRLILIVRVDTGSSFVFKKWLATSCNVLVNNRVLAAR